MIQLTLHPGFCYPIFEKTLTDPPGALGEAIMVWVRSAMDYRGTGLAEGKEGWSRAGVEACRALHQADPERMQLVGNKQVNGNKYKGLWRGGYAMGMGR